MITPPDLKLAEATNQEIQLELIRRCRINFLDGEKVAASLVKHRDLWLAAYLDQTGFSALLKLRDLPAGEWNVDTLFVLTKTLDKAKLLAQIAEDEEWEADDVVVYDNQEELKEKLGTSHPDSFIVSVWWD